MSEYVEQNPPFPLLRTKLNQLIREYYDAEFEDNKTKMAILKRQIDSLEIRMEHGEQYEVPF